MPTFGTYTDSRDGRVYTTVLMADGKWWSEDLAWAGSGDTGNYGRMYTYVQALVSCPPGTHLPTKTEFDAMLATCGDPATAGTRIKSTVTWNASGVPLGTNTYGISANAGGFRTSTGSAIRLGGMKSYWWSATEATATTAYRLSFMYNAENYLFPDDVKTDLYSVRFIVNSNPVFSPAPGNYSTAQTVAINTSVGITYYTTDGSTPTTASSVYSGPISVSTTKTLKAISVYAGVTSAVVSATYTIPVYGTYTDARDGRVYKTVLMPDGKWWFAENLAYFTSGVFDVNNSSSNRATYGCLYKQADAVSYAPVGTHVPSTEDFTVLLSSTGDATTAGKKLKANSALWSPNTGTDLFGFGVLPAGLRDQYGSYSDVGAYTYLWSTTDMGGGDASYARLISTQDGFGPSGAISKLLAFSVRVIVDNTPVFSPVSGSYTATQFVSISSGFGVVHYTTDGSTPTAASPVYSAPIAVRSTKTLKAISVYENIATPVVSATYTLPVFPLFGTYTDVRDGHVYNTVRMPDGNWWFAEDLAYTTPTSYASDYGRLYSWEDLPNAVPADCHIATFGEWDTLQKSLIDPTQSCSLLKSQSYWAQPGLDIYGFNAEPGGVLYYWSMSSNGPYGISVYWSSATGAQIAALAGGQASSETNVPAFIMLGGQETVAFTTPYSGTMPAVRCIASYSVPVTPHCAKPEASVAPGRYSSDLNVVLTSKTVGADIYYTLDGTVPTTGSLKYTAPVTIQATTVLKAMAANGVIDNSAVSEFSYVFAVGDVLSNVASGAYDCLKTIELRSNTIGADIYYTLDGTVPSRSSIAQPNVLHYIGPFVLAKTMQVQAIAIQTPKTQLDDSRVSVFDFQIEAPTVAIGADYYNSSVSRSDNTSAVEVQVTLSCASGASIYYTLTRDGEQDKHVSLPSELSKTGTYTDSRDGHVYKTVLMPDGKWWFAENLAWSGKGLDYSNDVRNRPVYGRLYAWQDAVAACPVGTRLPTFAEIQKLLYVCSGHSSTQATSAPETYDAATSYQAAQVLKSASISWLDTDANATGGLNSLSFAALPGGVKGQAAYADIGNRFCIWSSTLYGSTSAWSLDLQANSTSAYIKQALTDPNAFSVRCIVESGNVPDVQSHMYYKPISVLRTTTIRAVAVKDTLISSEYVQTYEVVPPLGVIFSPPPGTYTAPQDVVIRRRVSAPALQGFYTDSRDGHVYRMVLMPDGKWWSAENLAWAGAGVVPADPKYNSRYGRLYFYQEAFDACPGHWANIPSTSDWDNLIAAIGDVTGGCKLKAQSSLWNINQSNPVLTGTDDYGFSALPAGSLNLDLDANAIGLGTSSNFWTNSERSIVTMSLNDDVSTSFNAASDGRVACSVRFIVNEAYVVAQSSTDLYYPNAYPGDNLYYTTDGTQPIVASLTGKYTDPRDGHVYKTIRMPDGKWWFAENLAWASPLALPPEGNQANVATYGYLYKEDAATIVPPGTRVATSRDFDYLLAGMGAGSLYYSNVSSRHPGSFLLSSKLRHKSFANGLDEFGFGALAAGLMYVIGDGPDQVSMPLIKADGSPYYWFGDAAMFRDDTGNNVFSLHADGQTAQHISSTDRTCYRAVRCIVTSGNVYDIVGSAQPSSANQPMRIAQSSTIKAVATAGPNIGNVVTADYVIIDNTKVSAITFSPPGGTYASAQSVALSSATPGASIYYTTDGSTPKTYATGKYTDARDGRVYKTVLMPDGKWWFAENYAWIGVGQDVLGNSANRAVYGRWYSQAEAITYAPTGCHLPTQAEVTSMLSTFGVIHDSSDPSSLIGVAALRDSAYWLSNQGTNSSGFSARPAATNFIPGSFGLTASFITSTGLQTNYTAFRFSFNLSDHAFLSGGGGVDYSSVRYIVDSGNVQNNTSTLYTTPISVSTSTTLKAVASASGLNSNVTQAVYTFPVADLVFTPPAGAYATAQSVAISAPTPGAQLFYTVDGSQPTITALGTYTDTRDNHVYKTVLMPDGNWWLAENLAYASADSKYPANSAGNVANYGRLYRSSDTTAIPANTRLPTAAEITVLNYGPGAGRALKSTTLWGTPGSNSSGFSGVPGGALTPDGVTYFNTGNTGYYHAVGSSLTLVLTDANDAYTEVSTAGYWFSVRCIVNAANVVVTGYQAIGESGATKLYTTPVSVSSVQTTIKAIGAKPGSTQSGIASATYNFFPPSDVTFSPVGGVYGTAQAVTLACASAPANFAVGSTGTYTDPRDGHVYKTVLMPDGNWWFAEDREDIEWWGNLFWITYPPPVPDGCHSPTEAEWNAMFASVANPETVGRDLRSASSWETTIQSLDQYGFNAKPSGWIYYDAELGSPVYREQGTGAGWALGFDSGVDVNAPDFHNFVYLSGESLVPQFAKMVGSWAFAFRYIVDSGNVPPDESPRIFYTTDGTTPNPSSIGSGTRGTYTDSRDGHVYKTFLRTDGLWQFAENLAYVTAQSLDFDSNSANRAVYGLSYLVPDAEANMPAGCRMMDGGELMATVNDYGGTYAAGQHLKAASALWVPNTGDNTSGFSALPEPPYQVSHLVSASTDFYGIVVQAPNNAAYSATPSLNSYYAIRPIVVSGNVPDRVATQEYTSPISISKNTTVKAVASSNGLLSNVTQADYTIVSSTGLLFAVEAQDVVSIVGHVALPSDGNLYVVEAQDTAVLVGHTVQISSYAAVRVYSFELGAKTPIPPEILAEL